MKLKSLFPLRPLRLCGEDHAVRIGAVIGLLLLAAAIVMLWRQRPTVTAALQALHQMPAQRLALHAGVLLGTVVANVVLSGLLFRLLISRYGVVGMLEMQALIAASTLLNFVPMRPGLLGRVAYHKTCNNIAVAQTAKTVVQAITISAAVAAYLAMAVAVALKISVPLWLVAAGPIPVLGACAVVLKRLRIWLLAALVRYAEVLVIALRYHSAFALIGSPIEIRGALAFACISMIATMVPFLSNGLGLREWAVGLAAPLLTSYQMELGITADLVNRAAEMLVILPCGLGGMAYLTALRLRRLEPGTAAAPSCRNE